MAIKVLLHRHYESICHEAQISLNRCKYNQWYWNNIEKNIHPLIFKSKLLRQRTDEPENSAATRASTAFPVHKLLSQAYRRTNFFMGRLLLGRAVDPVGDGAPSGERATTRLARAEGSATVTCHTRRGEPATCGGRRSGLRSESKSRTLTHRVRKKGV